MSAARLSSPARRAKNARKGFIRINLATWERREMNDLCRAAGIPLNTALGWGVRKAREMLLEEATAGRRTGLNSMARHRLFGGYSRKTATN